MNEDLPKVYDMIKSFWTHNRSNNVLDTLRNPPLLTRSYSSYGYSVSMRDVHLVKILLQMLFVLPFTPKTVAKISAIYSEKLHHTFLPLFLQLYTRMPYEIIRCLRDQLLPNPTFEDMLIFLGSPFCQSVVITSLTNHNVKRLTESYSAQELKDFYYLLNDFDCTLGV
jgi:hypothetical protein